MTPRMIEDYYIKRKPKLMAQFEKYLPITNDILSKKIEGYKKEELNIKMREEFEALIPKIPYIGGTKSSYTTLLVECVKILAIYRVLEKEDVSFLDIGEFSYEFYEIIHKIKKRRLEKVGQNYAEQIFEDTHVNYLKNISDYSQKMQYEDDYIMEFVEGDGINFDYGFKITQCPIQKFYEKVGSEKFMPFVCLGDFAEANVCGYGFTRTQTLGNRDPICDHRYIKNGTTEKAWPPDNIKGWKIDDKGNFI